MTDKDAEQLRDHFASLAMQSLVSAGNPAEALAQGHIDHFAENVAAISYKIADCMLKARSAS